MEWDPAQRPGSATYRFLTSAVAPRPIAWVTTVSPAGVVNAAPFSWFNAVCADPPMVMLSIRARPDGSPKDTLRNLRDTGEFVVNAAPAALAQAMVQSSAEYPPEVSEVAELGLRTAPSVRVAPPRLADSPVHLECRLHRLLQLGRRDDQGLVLGEVVHLAADDGALDAEGNLDPTKVTLLGRMGGSRYVDTSRPFSIPWPDKPAGSATGAAPSRRGAG
ncbi:MAG TPA: flavin reductase family protein [Candidatus Thermoplasmatota archaeon]|nr:flavin reductase family protein [Candidatus Thermoplasmatota archaeon]